MKSPESFLLRFASDLLGDQKFGPAGKNVVYGSKLSSSQLL